MSFFDSLSSKFSELKVISSGSDGVVLSGVDKSLSSDSSICSEGSAVALKRLSLVGKGHCRIALRELRLLKRFSHENIVKTIKITDSNGCTIDDMENCNNVDSVYAVEELLDSDLHKIIEKNGKLPLETCKLFLYQLLRGLKYIHSANVVHRDIKPGNLFVKANDLSLKVGDYGLARVFDHRYKHKGYLTALVSTRFYRAPEVMLNVGDYSYPIDIWSAGCVFAEMLLGKVLFAGENDIDQINSICNAFGLTPSNFYTEEHTFPENLFTGFPPEVIDLLIRLLCIDPESRVTAAEALAHPFFAELHDPTDEPDCEQPFFVEHEIDNLPTKILKRKILRDSCTSSRCNSEKLRFSSSGSDSETFFKDFDESFVSTNVTTGDTKHRSPSWHTDTDSSNSTSVESTCDVVVQQKVTCSDQFIPSILDNVFTSVQFSDEPCRDPGVCERKYHEITTTTPKRNNAESEKRILNINVVKIPVPTKEQTTQQSYFSNLSPVIELSDFYESNDFLEIGRLCAGNKKVVDLDKLNNSIMNRLLQERSSMNKCGLENLLMSQRKANAPVTHWDSLRFWA